MSGLPGPSDRVNTYNVPTDALLVHGKRLHRQLHPVEARRLPDKVRGEVMRAVRRHAIRPPELQPDLVRHICESEREA